MPAAAHLRPMTSSATPAPAISLDINVDPFEKGTLSLAAFTLGHNPYVVVQFKMGGDRLVLETDIGGNVPDIAQMGALLKTLGAAIESQGEALTAQALASESQSATVSMKGSDL